MLFSCLSLRLSLSPCHGSPHAMPAAHQTCLNRCGADTGDRLGWDKPAPCDQQMAISKQHLHPALCDTGYVTRVGFWNPPPPPPKRSTSPVPYRTYCGMSVSPEVIVVSSITTACGVEFAIAAQHGPSQGTSQ
ncbi:hypothetical protein EDB81DRAFT_140059 [Dactylonectria macrodidyma]|uniref:Secreted protein n=1 Tax=Dactylonectria macrodidyma TaxID=307937 RepID=A0A9P9E1V7_9HYPO|nr:hypothetical protein EDB81DRAFT_140059 [Dactylonectria macrodidyma]